MKKKIWIFGSHKQYHFFTIKKMIVLFVLVLLASTVLIFINYYTIKTTSAVRAYINGESEYSKGQKDALLYLLTYVQTGDQQYWPIFRNSLNIPIGDNLARRALVNNGNTETIKEGFLMGKNDPDDLDKMIWLFKNFQSVSFMKEAIQIWHDAEPLINELAAIGEEINDKIKTGTLTPARRQELLGKINIITTELTQKERAFSNTLGNAARLIDMYLFLANIFLTVLIVGSLMVYVIIIINKLVKSEQELIEKNKDLTTINREMDTFVYSASHDLRSPITSLKGLVQITSHENKEQKVEKYLNLMNTVINRLDTFIKEIIDFSRNKRTTVNAGELSLKNIIDESIAQNKFLPAAGNITIEKEINVDTIYTDVLRMQIIMSNLISNAIKYSDDQKSNKHISIRTSKSGTDCMIEIEDNGIGISEEYHERIFDMFFVTDNDQKGTGLGLYIVKETVEKLNGTITVESQKDTGTKFTIKIPFRYEQ